MREPDHDTLEATVKRAFIDAGWLVGVEIRKTESGPRLFFSSGIGLADAAELVLTIEAGVRKRVIRQ
ncbi:hypothetical protein [Streptomyces misionensis]|uniref:hypothetical protein n=1 Tax=Streptomyces misionensis TaxID=67331 RepID=UPI0036C0DFE3